MGFAVTDAATGLKLIEAGVPKETLAMLAVPMIPIQITLPWIISRYATGIQTCFGRALQPFQTLQTESTT